MKTPGHRFKNKTKRIACSESCTVEVLTARHWGFNTFSESLRGGTVTEGKFTHVVHQQIPSWFWKSLFCKWLQIRWGNCENSCPFLILTRHPLWHCQREILGWADLCVSSCLQHILLSGTAVDESQLWDRSDRTWAEGMLTCSRLKKKTTLDKMPWEVDKEREIFAFSCLYSSGKARALGLVFLFTIACSVQSTIGLSPLQINRWSLPYLISI